MKEEQTTLIGWIVFPFRVAVCATLLWFGYWLQPDGKPLAYFGLYEWAGFVLMLFGYALIVRSAFVLLFKGIKGFAP